MKEHHVSLETPLYEATLRNERNAEHRHMAEHRDFAVGDWLVIHERPKGARDRDRWPEGRSFRRQITHIDKGPECGVRWEYALLHLAPAAREAA